MTAVWPEDSTVVVWGSTMAAGPSTRPPTSMADRSTAEPSAGAMAAVSNIRRRPAASAVPEADARSTRTAGALGTQALTDQLTASMASPSMARPKRLS